MYADDTVLYVSGNNVQTLAYKLQASLDNFVRWSSLNKLTINESKTKLVLFSSLIKHKLFNFNDFTIKIKEERLKFVPTYKYLGVILDFELNFNAHVKDLRKRLGYKSYILANLRFYVPTNIMLRIYNTYTLPVIDYADIAYNFAKTDILSHLQNQKLSDRRTYHAQIYGFKCTRKNDMLDVRPRHTRLATAPLLKYDNVISASYDHSIEVFTAKSWNVLLPVHRNIQEISKFKVEMKVLLQNKVELYED